MSLPYIGITTTKKPATHELKRSTREVIEIVNSVDTDEARETFNFRLTSGHQHESSTGADAKHRHIVGIQIVGCSVCEPPVDHGLNVLLGLSEASSSEDHSVIYTGDDKALLDAPAGEETGRLHITGTDNKGASVN